jgi:multimeric flavodoxin WrbA
METKQTMKYSDINNFIIRANFYLKNFEGENKLKHYIKKAFSELELANKQHNNKIEDLRIDLAMEDEKGALIIDEKGNYKYTKENTKKLNRMAEELYDLDYEVTPISLPEHVSNYDTNLTEEQIEVFSKFLISRS